MSQPSAAPAQPPFGRVLTAMVTPMLPGGEVDLDGVDAVVEHLVATGHDGIVVNGTTGESATLSSDESIAVVERVVATAAGRAKVVAGVGSNNTAHAVSMAGRAAAVGAAGCAVALADGARRTVASVRAPAPRGMGPAIGPNPGPRCGEGGCRRAPAAGWPGVPGGASSLEVGLHGIEQLLPGVDELVHALALEDREDIF